MLRCRQSLAVPPCRIFHGQQRAVVAPLCLDYVFMVVELILSKYFSSRPSSKLWNFIPKLLGNIRRVLKVILEMAHKLHACFKSLVSCQFLCYNHTESCEQQEFQLPFLFTLEAYFWLCLKEKGDQFSFQFFVNNDYTEKKNQLFCRGLLSL